MRSDAQKNRERLLVAAGQVFEEKGLEASVADVARVAGVGMGTLYRRFASKEALIEALVSEVLEATIAMAQEAATRPDGTVHGGPDRATGDPDTINRGSAMYGTPDQIAQKLDEGGSGVHFVVDDENSTFVFHSSMPSRRG